MVMRKDKTGKRVTGSDGLSYDVVPCGRCLACRIERSKAWAIRLMLETLCYSNNCFVTLTYDEEHVPLVPPARFGQLPFTLCKKDCQDFLKRLRKDLDCDGRKIKYYLVGEYGDHTFRPHYHVIFFGLGKQDEQLIVDNWRLGIVDVGDVTLASCNYVAGYVQKKLYGDVSADVYGNRLPPYSVMSKGLGKSYFMENCDKLLKDGFILYRDKHIMLPRYFFNLMAKECPELATKIACFKAHRKSAAIKALDKHYADLGVDDPRLMESFEERKRIAKARNLEILSEIKERNKI